MENAGYVLNALRLRQSQDLPFLSFTLNTKCRQTSGRPPADQSQPVTGCFGFFFTVTGAKVF